MSKSKTEKQPRVQKKESPRKTIETHGKVEQTTPSMLEQVWGYNASAKFGTLKEEEYSSRLKDMQRADLETEARKHGIVIVESTARLREKILNEFKGFVASLNKPVQKPRQQRNPDPAALKVLAEGR